MSAYLLYRRSTSTTGRALARTLRINGGTRVPDERVDLIRWGNTERVPRKPNRFLNSRKAILSASDKLESLRLLRAGGVSVPTSHALSQDTAQLFAYPALARRINHTQGRDIKLCLQPNDAFAALEEGAEYLVQYIPTKTEYRVHVFRDQVIKVSQKVLTSPENVLPWIRNHEYGYTFRKARTPPSQIVTNMCIAAVSLLGLDFGAVDVLVSTEGIPWILEVNTAPGLVASGLRVYAQNIATAFGLELPEQPETQEEDNEETEATDDGRTED